MLRTIAERLTHNIIIKRRLPDKVGGAQIYTSSEGGLKYLRWNIGNVDPALLRMAAELVKPGFVVWDIGANLGLFSFAAAGLAGPTGKILAVEPDMWLVNLLRRSARLNTKTRSRVDILPVAVSGEVGVFELCIAKRARSASYLNDCQSNLSPDYKDQIARSVTGGVREKQLVVSITLDWLLDQYSAPDCVKIDIEGAEISLFRGATKVMSDIRPVVLLEVFEPNSKEVSHILHSFEYVMFDADIAKPERQPLTSAVWNTVAYPAECLSNVY